MSEYTMIMAKKTRRVILGCCFAIIILAVLYFTGILKGISGSNGLGNLSDLRQYASTGMVAPATKDIAYVDNGMQYAANTPQGKNLASQNVAGKNVAMGQNPVVLFDISTNPALKKTYNLLTWIWLGTGIISLIVLIFLLKGYIRNKRIQKAKENT